MRKFTSWFLQMHKKQAARRPQSGRENKNQDSCSAVQSAGTSSNADDMSGATSWHERPPPPAILEMYEACGQAPAATAMTQWTECARRRVQRFGRLMQAREGMSLRAPMDTRLHFMGFSRKLSSTNLRVKKPAAFQARRAHCTCTVLCCTVLYLTYREVHATLKHTVQCVTMWHNIDGCTGIRNACELGADITCQRA